MTKTQERVERGAALLDERLPGWAQEIYVENLDLSDSCDCVLGQLFGDYLKGVRVLGLADETWAEPARLGFHRPDRRTQWETLSRAWRSLIARRQT